MNLHSSFVSILRCPETLQKLTPATAEQIAAINQSGLGVEISEALMREDQLVAYPIDDGYPVLLLDRQLRRADGASW